MESIRLINNIKCQFYEFDTYQIFIETTNNTENRISRKIYLLEKNDREVGINCWIFLVSQEIPLPHGVGWCGDGPTNPFLIDGCLNQQNCFDLLSSELQNFPNKLSLASFFTTIFQQRSRITP